jgi:hypothetical protein
MKFCTSKFTLIGMWYHVAWYVGTNILEQSAAFIFTTFSNPETGRTQPHGITSQNIVILMVSAVTTYYPTYQWFSSKKFLGRFKSKFQYSLTRGSNWCSSCSTCISSFEKNICSCGGVYELQSPMHREWWVISINPRAVQIVIFSLV